MSRSRCFSRLAVVVSASLLAVIVSVFVASAMGAAANTWSVAADNVQAPGYQTATVLADGRVLVVGGQGTKAELFDPATGTWSVAASMNRSRAYTTATLLPNGEVLVAGGFDGSVPLASAELYDPGLNRWTLTGSMATGRLQHTATLLGNGKVLVAGGTIAGNNMSTATAELYDPTIGTFTPTGSMTRARAVFTATLLRDGTVLVADWVSRISTTRPPERSRPRPEGSGPRRGAAAAWVAVLFALEWEDACAQRAPMTRALKAGRLKPNAQC